MKIILKALRVNSGFTIDEVATYICKTSKTIKNWEDGSTIPDGANIEMLAKLYKVESDYIFLADKLALSKLYQENKLRLIR